jgi:hypothetical protein
MDGSGRGGAAKYSEYPVTETEEDLNTRIALLGAALSAGAALFAQTQNVYTGTVVTGQLNLFTTTNISQISAASQVSAISQLRTSSVMTAGPERPGAPRRLPLPPTAARSVFGHIPEPLSDRVDRHIPASAQAAVPAIASASSNVGFNGMTHSDQRLANSGNQFSVEPPNPSIAVANGDILEGVNNAVRVFTTSGAPLTATIASNQLFGLAPAINRTVTPNVYGPFPEDMRVFFDQDTSRWFVLQRAQDEDTLGNLLSDSHIYLAVSQTSDPTGAYNIYIMDTSDVGNTGCPCLDDYPQIGADHYGFYISANEYSIQDPNNPAFNDAVVLAISKADLAGGSSTPKAFRFIVPFFTGYEFTIHPASTPPGASTDLASGGVEFFVSSYPAGYDTNLAVWALSNTASLQSPNPNLLLMETTVPTLAHESPQYGVPQLSGPLTLGTTLELLDAGYFSDSRVISTVYSGGRLFVTLASEVLDANNNPVVGCLYVVFAPTFRGGVVGATLPDKQGYLAATNNHILRPAVAVDPQGRGAIAFTLVGPDYYPSAAFVSIDTTAAPPSSIQVVGAGVLPEDGFSGYGPLPACPTCDGNGIARWGDYSTAVTSTDGSIWFVSEYIPNLPRTPLANWGTFISQYVP